MVLSSWLCRRSMVLRPARRASGTDSLFVLTRNDAMAHLNSKKRFPVPPPLFPEVFLDWAKHACSTKNDANFENEYQLGVNIREIRRKHLEKLTRCEEVYAHAKELMYTAGNVPGHKESVGELTTRLNSEILNLQYYVASYQILNTLDIQDHDDMIRVPIQLAQSEASNAILGQSMATKLYSSSRLRQRQLYAIEMLPRKLQQLNEKLAQRRKLQTGNAEYKKYVVAEKALHDLQRSIGLVEAMEQLRRFKVRSGRGREQRGNTFEDYSMEVVRERLLPRLAVKHNVPVEDMFCLRNSKLALAQGTGGAGEFDCIVCVRAPKPARLENFKHRGVYCKVLAIVEFKRCLDDVGEAFFHYQSTLSWLVGLEDTYDAARWIAPNYPTGHFKDSPFIQYYDNIATGRRGNGRKSLGVNNDMQLLVMLTPESFADFVRTPIVPKKQVLLSPTNEVKQEVAQEVKRSDHGTGEVDNSSGVSAVSPYKTIDAITSTSLSGMNNLFLQDIYFVSKDSYIEGVTSKQLSWVLYKIAGGMEFDNTFSNPAAVNELRDKLTTKMPHVFSTLELLHVYEQYNCMEQMYLVGKFPNVQSEQ